MGQNLRTFLADAIASDPGAVKVVETPIDRRVGMQAYAAKAAQRSEYPILLFTNIVGSPFRAVGNVLGSYAHVALALRCDIEDIPRIYGEKLNRPIAPITVDDAPCKEVIVTGDDLDVTVLPLTWHNELDAAPYITGGVSSTRDLQTGIQNAGIYRHQVYGPREVGALLGGGHHGSYNLQKYEERNQRMPIAIAIGMHPAVQLAAVARLAHSGGEYDTAGAFLGEPVELVRAEMSELLVPAEAEIVIEGFIEPHARREEGPFGEWPGHYLGDAEAPVVTISAITHRRDALYHDVMSSAREHLLLGGLPRTGSIFAAVKQLVPNLVAVNCPPDTRMHCYLSINRRRNVDVKRAAMAALSVEPENLRAVIVVDDDINIFNDSDVMWAIGTRFDAADDLTILKKWSGPGGLLPTNWIYLPDGSRTPRASSAMIIDATKPFPAPYPPRTKVSDEALASVNAGDMKEVTLQSPFLPKP